MLAVRLLAPLLLLPRADGLVGPRALISRPLCARNVRCNPWRAARSTARLNEPEDAQPPEAPSLPAALLPIGRAAAAAHDSATRMHPLLQGCVTLVLYLVHMLVLSKHALAFPVQLFPNDRGQFQCIGYDSLAGIAVLVLVALGRRARGASAALPPALRVPREGSDGLGLPWRVDGGTWREQLALKAKAAGAVALLVYLYQLSGQWAMGIEMKLYWLAAHGLPITIAMHRSLQVLLAHLVWVVCGASVLAVMFSKGAREPFSFFASQRADRDGSGSDWLRFRWRSGWLWWVTGGYYVSSLIFNFADLINQYLIPMSTFEAESIVSKMINPENNDLSALAAGAIAPCISAPWWEEVLYRGFMLPAIALFMPLWLATPVSAVLFSAHHLQLASCVPLAALGFVWAVLYIQSRNLVVTILIHAMWNSRVFLGSLLGL